MIVERMIEASSKLRDDVGKFADSLVKEGSVDAVYNPLAYGLDWPKEEVSGTRLWGLLANEYGSAESIFKSVFLLNHCPLMLFSGERATNITPDKITGPTTKALLERCDEHLREVVDIMQIERVIGVGRYSEKRALNALSGIDISVTTCWHPSPASPLANRNKGEDWKKNVRNVLP